MRCRNLVGIVLASLVFASAAPASIIVTFQILPPPAFSANDMSPDGRWVVGQTDLNGDFSPDGGYRLDTLTQTMTLLPVETLNAVAVSNDGKVILGDIPDPDDPDSTPDVAAIWREATGTWQSLGYLPNAGECPSRSNGYELSADGAVAVGLSWDGCSGRGFRWTEATGMQQLQNLALGANRASVCSADGNLIGGFAQGTQSRTPAIWDGLLTGQTLDPSYNARGEVFGINDAGTIMLGTWGTTEPVNRAVKWTLGESGWQREMLGTGSLGPAIQWTGIPMDIADDGTIVGFDFYLGNRIAWILLGGSPPYLDLKAFVNANGGSVPDEYPLMVCQAISTNGRFIIGHGQLGAWRVTIDRLGDMNCDGRLDTDDIDPFVQALLDPASYQAAHPLCPISLADMNDDGAEDGLDVAGLVSGLLGS
jgi:hypothetical protein